MDWDNCKPDEALFRMKLQNKLQSVLGAERRPATPVHSHHARPHSHYAANVSDLSIFKPVCELFQRDSHRDLDKKSSTLFIADSVALRPVPACPAGYLEDFAI